MLPSGYLSTYSINAPSYLPSEVPSLPSDPDYLKSISMDSLDSMLMTREDSLGKSTKPEDIIWLAEIYRSEDDYDNAILQYDKFKSIASVSDPTASGYAETCKKFTLAVKNKKLRYEGGIYLVSVTSGGNAEKAGLKVGDLIVTYNGKGISDEDSFTSGESSIASGTIDLQYLRLDSNGNFQLISTHVPAGKMGFSISPV
jgi:C-terminal processing protease CtpA/Prc